MARRRAPHVTPRGVWQAIKFLVRRPALVGVTVEGYRSEVVLYLTVAWHIASKPEWSQTR
jgi:hypothetical protein